MTYCTFTDIATSNFAMVGVALRICVQAALIRGDRLNSESVSPKAATDFPERRQS